MLGTAIPSLAAYSATAGTGRMGISVGAGAMSYVASYVAQESPGSGMAVDARVDYRLSPALVVEGGGTTAFSGPVQGGDTTVLLLLERGLRAETTPGRKRLDELAFQLLRNEIAKQPREFKRLQNR